MPTHGYSVADTVGLAGIGYCGVFRCGDVMRVPWDSSRRLH